MRMQANYSSTADQQAKPEVLIVGAGPAGLSMACALANAGVASCVLEANSLASLENPTEDGREIALTHKGIAILQALGQWQDLPATEIAPLRRAHVFNGDSPDHLAFDAEGSGREVLGQLVANHWLRRVAYQGVLKRQALITIRADSRVAGIELGAKVASLTLSDGERLTAPLLIAADSRFSAIRRQAGIGAQLRDFGRSVIAYFSDRGRPFQSDRGR